MIRIAFLDTADERFVPHVLSDAAIVTRHFSVPVNGKESVEHMASTIERPATADEVSEWRKQ